MGLCAAGLLVAAASTPLVASGWDPAAGAGARIGASEQQGAGISASVTFGAPVRVADTVWSGSAAWPLTPPSGRVTVDALAGRVTDDDPASDYYVLLVDSTWTAVTGVARLPAPVTIAVTSDTRATGNLYDATDTFTSAASCDETLALPAGSGFTSTAAQVCRGYAVERLAYDDTSATWRIDQPSGLRHLELAYSFRVPQGTRPLLSVDVTTPTGARSSVPWSTPPLTESTSTATLTP